MAMFMSDMMDVWIAPAVRDLKCLTWS